jgi:hypothetical protein
MAHNSGLNGRDGGFAALQGTRLSEQFKDMIVGTSPGAQALKAGAFKTDISVYEAAEAKARAANSAARTQSCAGAPGEIFPWAETVLGPELLARVEPALLTPTALARRGESGSSLQVTPTRAELGVARTLGMTHEGDSAEEMLKAASALGTPARQPRPVPKPRGSSPRPHGIDAAENEAMPSQATPRRLSSPRSFDSQPAGARAVLDAGGAQHLSESFRAYHEQYAGFFKAASNFTRGEDGPTLWFSDCDPLVGSALVGALKGQIALLHVARRSLSFNTWRRLVFSAAICQTKICLFQLTSISASYTVTLRPAPLSRYLIAPSESCLLGASPLLL